MTLPRVPPVYDADKKKTNLQIVAISVKMTPARKQFTPYPFICAVLNEINIKISKKKKTVMSTVAL